jgi:catechol 2,3-dioxygenase-like lactoylglutathione lyase family enzyme
MTRPSSPITGVDYVSVPTANLETATEFYGEVLGLRSPMTYGRGAEFETGSLTLQVIESPSIGREYRPNAHPIVFQVKDVEAARAELESRGVAFGDTFDSGVCLNAPFEDPDGNPLVLHQRYLPRS